MEICCFCHCFLCSRTKCIMWDGAVRKFYPWNLRQRGISVASWYRDQLINSTDNASREKCRMMDVFHYVKMWRSSCSFADRDNISQYCLSFSVCDWLEMKDGHHSTEMGSSRTVENFTSCVATNPPNKTLDTEIKSTWWKQGKVYSFSYIDRPNLPSFASTSEITLKTTSQKHTRWMPHNLVGTRASSSLSRNLWWIIRFQISTFSTWNAAKWSLK